MKHTPTLGCQWIDQFGDTCGEDIEDSIVLRDRLIAGRVLVCSSHKAEYNRMAAASRVTRKQAANHS